MARKKLEKVPVYLKAQSRSAALAGIDKSLDLSNGNTLAAYSKEVDKYKDLLAGYNTALTTVDEIGRAHV